MNLRFDLLIFLIFCTACSTTPANQKREPAQASLSCAVLLQNALGKDAALQSWRITSNIKPLRVIQHDEFIKWTYDEWKSTFGKVYTFSFGTADLSANESVAQQVLSTSDFSLEQLKIIKTLRQLQQRKKYRRKSARSTYNEKYDLRKFVLDKAIANGISTQLTIQDVEAAAHEDANAQLAKNVEVGFISVLLKDGSSKNIVFTSSRDRFLFPDDFMRALTNSLTKTPVMKADIVAFQFFHTHPNISAAPLSSHDVRAANEFRKIFLENGANIDVHIYAISGDSTGTLVFHYGVGP